MGNLIAYCKRNKYNLCCDRLMTACIMGHSHCIEHLYRGKKYLINPLCFSILARNGDTECLHLLYEYNKLNGYNSIIDYENYISDCA